MEIVVLLGSVAIALSLCDIAKGLYEIARKMK